MRRTKEVKKLKTMSKRAETKGEELGGERKMVRRTIVQRGKHVMETSKNSKAKGERLVVEPE